MPTHPFPRHTQYTKQIGQHIKFRDQKSGGFYTEGRILSIHDAKHVEVGYRAPSWSHPK